MKTKSGLLTQAEFIKKVHIGCTKLKQLQAEGKYNPVLTTNIGKTRYYFSEEQVTQFITENQGYNCQEFADMLGISETTLRNWVVNGIIEPDHVNHNNQVRFTNEQYKKFLDGDYDYNVEKNFYNSRQIANKFGVSYTTALAWIRSGKFTLNHMGKNGIRFFNADEVDKIYNEKMIDKSTL